MEAPIPTPRGHRPKHETQFPLAHLLMEAMELTASRRTALFLMNRLSHNFPTTISLRLRPKSLDLDD